MSEQDFKVTVDPDGVWRVECPAIPETYCRGDTRKAAFYSARLVEMTEAADSPRTEIAQARRRLGM